MRILRTSLSLAGVSLLFAGQLVAAQNPGFGAPRGFFGRDGAFGARVVTGQPYSGVRTTTFVQTLSSGGTINRTTTTNEARDSNGRFYRQTVVSGGSGAARTMSSVFDPTNRTITNWSSDKQQATVRQLPNFSGHRPDSAGSQPDGQQRQFHRNGPTPVVTQLGSKTLSGVEVTGTRTTITFPAGSFGNSEAVTVTHERWVSQDLGVTVMETDSDPRDGVRTTTLSNIQRTEPDQTLFQVPQGYTVTQHLQGQRF
jgi:hypothetical protein